MENCFLETLSADIAIDCDNLSISGLEADAVVIPWEDVDFTASTVDPENKLLITDLVLKAAATGFTLQGIKQTNSTNSEFVPGDDNNLDLHRHTFGGRILTPSTANRLQANKLSKGKPYVVVVNKKWKGAGQADAFHVLGWKSGLYLTSMTENSLENNAAIVFQLASKDNMLESDLPKNLLDVDYPTTLAAFNNKFVEPELP